MTYPPNLLSAADAVNDIVPDLAPQANGKGRAFAKNSRLGPGGLLMLAWRAARKSLPNESVHSILLLPN
ncbi:MAG: hypothetical protein EXS30_08455 [Pedosphaera sp.]|nr:hypothetical protein [Pedosphaera sp.]